MTSPTQRTLALLRKNGGIAQVVEKWQPQAKRRIDLFGFIDIVWLAREGSVIWGVQATSGTNHSARLLKIKEEPRARRWLECGGRIMVISWSKKGPRGKRKLWEWRATYINSVKDLENA